MTNSIISLLICIFISASLSFVTTTIVIVKFLKNWRNRTLELSLIIILCAYDWIWAIINFLMVGAYLWSIKSKFIITASDPACYLQAYGNVVSINGELVTTACISHAIRVSMQHTNNKYACAYYIMSFVFPFVYSLMYKE